MLLAETEQEEEPGDPFLSAAGLLANITTLTAIGPVAVVLCADALEIINRPSKQVNAVVDFAKITFALFLKNKLLLLKIDP
jgi:hypothetical protein